MTDTEATAAGPATNHTTDPDEWLRRLCTLLVASVAAYASYIHQRAFALQGGADTISASLWPLSVDGLLLLATVGLLKPPEHTTPRTRSVIWTAFLLGIAVSLAANIAAAPTLHWQPVLVAGWPPAALLLSVELLAHRPAPETNHTAENRKTTTDPLWEQALTLDARHRDLHQRPISAETLRKELHIGATRSRHLTALIRTTHSTHHDTSWKPATTGTP